MNIQMIEMSLLTVLIIFMYKVPRFIVNSIRTKFMKFLLICAVIYIYRNCGLNSGIMASLIFICLLFNSYNGMEGYKNLIESVEEREEDLEETVTSVNNITDLNRKIKENSEKAKIEAKRQPKIKNVPKIN